MSALNYSGHTSSTPATFPGLLPFITSLTSCYRDLSLSIPQSLLILLSYLLSKDLLGHLCSLSRVLVLSTPFLALTPTSCLCHSSVIDLVMLNSSSNSSYLSQQPFLLLQPSSLTNFSNRPWYYVSLHCFSHYTSLFISVSVVPILRPPFSILPLSSPRSFPMFCTIFSY